MKALIVTIAGTATRFNRDTHKETLKSLYYEKSPEYSLLYQILDKSRDFNKIIIVGGYLYDTLLAFVENYLDEFKHQIELVFNPHYEDYGSGYSLIKGIENLPVGTNEVIFVEGDLFFDENSFNLVKKSPFNVVTMNREFITSQKAVVFYVDESDHIHYVYDTNHHLISIPSPMKAIYNSGQIWKFASVEKLHLAVNSLSQKQSQGTNLEIIQNYFGDISIDNLAFITLNTWINCNTVSDYKNVYSLL